MIRDIYTDPERALLSDCTLCPRECHAGRFEGRPGYCGADAGMNIASICIHRGEEPPVSGPSGICNVFFSGCNLRCVYCQNHEISRPAGGFRPRITRLDEALDIIESLLGNGVNAVGFVSPSHVVPQVKAIIRGLHSRGLRPVFVYNTNGYDKADVIGSLEGLIDVWLPDCKYASETFALEYSDAADYPSVALCALKKMYWLKGSPLQTDSEGRAVGGILIRHLVLPGHADESKQALRMIAEELSPGVNISLMSQYHPTPDVAGHPVLGRALYKAEYDSVAKEMEELGFRNGWIQDPGSCLNYRPDFSRDHPFE
ncbi:MAG: radical SAM protein [Bacteroidales bacterium]